MNWLDAVRALPKQALVVSHNPMTPRYDRALAKMSYLLRRSILLGERDADQHADAVEIATWAPPPTGRGDGYYCCFRLHLDEHGQVWFARLFCFYDGTESSHGFKSSQTARGFSRQQGFSYA